MSENIKTHDHSILTEEELENIRKLTIISLFSDDDLMDILVLKGGNALEIAYKMHSRASMDIDVSMRTDFDEVDLNLDQVVDKLGNALFNTFSEAGYIAFDVKLEQKPRRYKEGQLPEWGGYKAFFKLIRKEDPHAENNQERSVRSLPLDGNKKTIEIDISKYEYCGDYQEVDIDGYTIKVYSLEMIVFEKLRAICQQLDTYENRTRKKPRPRDFYDIYVICESDRSGYIDFRDPSNRDMLRNFFEIKKVPLSCLDEVKNTKEYHEQEFQTVRDTVKNSSELKDFDFYFNYVVKKIEELESFWVE